MDDPTQQVQNAPDAAPLQAAQQPPAASGAAPVSPAPTPPGPPSQQPASQAQQTTGTVSNSPAVNTPAAQKSVQRASILHSIAQALAGGPRYQLVSNSDGTVSRTPVPLTRGQILSAIALEAISGSLTGLAQHGPDAEAKAAQAGFQQGVQQRTQQERQAEQQAEQDAAAKSQALVRAAQAFEANSRSVLNTAQSERFGVESLKDAVSANAQLLSDYEDAGSVIAQHISQDSLMAGLKDGTYSPTQQVAVPDGFTNVDGRYEQTFSVVGNASVKVPLSAQQAQAYGNAGIQGWLQFAGGRNKLPDGTAVPGWMVLDANNKLQAVNLMKQEFSTVADALSKSDDKGNRQLAASIPPIKDLLSDKNNGPVLQGALLKFQKYVSHSDWHNMDFYESLQQMAAPSKPSPQNPKQFVPNSDAPYASAIAGAFGNGDPQRGWAILKAFHDEVTPEPIKNEADAASLIANNSPDSKTYRVAQRWIASNNAQKAAQARATAQAKQAAGNTGTGNPQFANETPVNGVRPNYLANLPSEDRSLVESIGKGLIDPAGRLLYRKDGQRIMQEVTSAFPGYDFSRAPTYVATRKAFTSGKESQAINAFNTAMGHMLVMYQNASLGASLPVVGAVERAAGNQQAINLADSRTALVDELGKAYKAGALTDQEQRIWKGRIDSWSPAEIRGNAVAFVTLLDSKLSSYEAQWRNGSPPGAVAPIQILSPEARNAYTLITGRQPITGSGLTNIQVNPATHQQIGWDGRQWVDLTTRQPVTGGR